MERWWPLRRQEPTRTAVATATQWLVRYAKAGRFVDAPSSATPGTAYQFAQESAENMAVLLYPAPTSADVDELAREWDLHPLLTEDLQQAGQRPKLERYGDVLSLVVRAAYYVDEAEDVRLAEFHMLVKGDAIAVLCQDGLWIDGTPAAAYIAQVEGPSPSGILDRGMLEHGPEAVIYRLIDAIVDGFTPVLQGLGIDKEQIERQVFGGSSEVAERIYRLNQEVIDLQHAATSLTEIVEALRRGHARYGIPDALQSYLQDVADHLEIVDRRVTELRDALAQILTVNATLVAQRQNEDMKKISGWAAILFAPTLIGAIYGMNFDDMPELHWTFGYPAAVAAMVALGVGLWVVFRKKKWM